LSDVVVSTDKGWPSLKWS